MAEVPLKSALRASLSALVLAVIARGTAVAEEARSPRWRVVTRLVDERYRPQRDGSTGAVPTAEIAAERRPVLATSDPVRLTRQTVPPPGARRVVLDVPIPERLRGVPLRLVASVETTAVGVTGQAPRVVSAPEGRVKLEVGLTREGVDRATTIVVSGRAGPPETRYLSQPVAVPPGARLQFGIGVDEAEWSPAMPAVGFTVTAVTDARETVLFRKRLDPGAHPEQRRWSDHAIDLAPYAGQRVRLRFESTLEAKDPAAPFVFPVWSDPTVVVPMEPGQRRGNLILVSVDTLRADHLGCYGYRRPTSPTIDTALAARGTLFEKVFATSPWTFPSHAAMLTGLYSCTGRLFGTNGAASGASPLGELPADAATLAEMLRARGYATAAFTEDGWISSEMGFARGFGTYVENRAFPRFSEPLGQVEQTLDHALRWIRRNAESPWFVFVHTYQVHNPYTPPPGYLERVAPEYGDDRASADAAAYDGEIRYTDDVLVRFLAGLDAAGAGDALLALTSDHGEQFNEHGLYMHGNSLYEELLHVPLILRAPGLVPSGKRISTDVGLLDLVPTLLELLGLPPPARAEGRSLVPLIQRGDEKAVPLFADLVGTVAVRHLGFKWIIDEKSGAAQVFELATDPHEMKNLDGARPLPVDAARWLRDFHALCPPAAQGQPPALPNGAIDPAVREKLRALGYLD